MDRYHCHTPLPTLNDASSDGQHILERSTGLNAHLLYFFSVTRAQGQRCPTRTSAKKGKWRKEKESKRGRRRPVTSGKGWGSYTKKKHRQDPKISKEGFLPALDAGVPRQKEQLLKGNTALREQRG
eukprot:scaffold321809_cov18-Tisochrysis_lutea.AAC.2